MRRQKREREREKQRLQQGEFKLERRKALEVHQQPQLEYPPAPPSFVSTSTTTTSNYAEARFPLNANPQFAKWIMEQNFHCNPEKETELDIQGSMSSLTNIPERDRANSPVVGYAEPSAHPKPHSSDQGGNYNPPSPPVRDTGPSRPSDYTSSLSHFDGLEGMSSRTDSDVPSKFSEYTTSEPDHHFVPIPNSDSILPPQPSSTTSYTNNFSSLGSQPTLSSQQMLTPYSQQHPSAHGNSQLLDRLSMDVMQHTQHTGSLVDGITSLVPKFKATKPKDLPHPLERSDLKDLEMDEIDLIKQRLELMHYSQQKRGRDLGRHQEHSPNATKGGSEDHFRYPTHMTSSPDDLRHQESCSKLLGDDEDDDVFPEHGDRSLSIYQLHQELKSLEQMVSDQKKRCKEIKMAKEREELKLRQREQELTSSSAMLGVNPRDQHRWQREQKRRLRELDKIRSEQNKRLQQFEYDEHRARSKLKAFEAQAREMEQQIARAEANSNLDDLRPSPTGGYPITETQRETPELYKSVSHPADMAPSKLPVGSDDKGTRAAMKEDRAHATSPSFSSTHVAAPAEREWVEFASKSSRVMSMESMATSTWITSEQPDIAKEVATTMSLSTEPTQDEPLLPPPSNWAVHDTSSGPITTPIVQSTNPNAQVHSRSTLSENQLSEQEHPLDTADKDFPGGSSGGLMKSDEVNSHAAQQERQQCYELHQKQSCRTSSHERMMKTEQNVPTMAKSEHGRVPRTPDTSRLQTVAPRIHSQQVPHQHTWLDSHGMQPYERYPHRLPQQGLQRTRLDHSYPRAAPQLTEHPIQGSPVVQSPPDVVPTALDAHQMATTERTTSPLMNAKYSGIPSSASVHHHQGTFFQSNRPHYSSHPPHSSLTRQEQNPIWRSPVDRPTPISTHASPRYVPASVRSSLSPSPRTAQELSFVGKRSLNSSHDHSTTANSGAAYENVKSHSTPERDTTFHLPTSTSVSSPPKPSHRYAVSRPENKGVGRSYSRGRPDNVTYDGRPKVNLEKPRRSSPQSHYQGLSGHPERIHRQQTEL